jgi:adhesin/invasin
LILICRLVATILIVETVANYRHIPIALSFFLAGGPAFSGDYDTGTNPALGADNAGLTVQANIARTVAAAANSATPEKTAISSIVNDTAQHLGTVSANAIDSAIPNSTTEISITGAERQKPKYEIINVTGISGDDSAGKAQTFIQSGLGNANERPVFNLGIGQRYLSNDENVIIGLNAFYDVDLRYGHRRASIGGEVKASAVELGVNKYAALSKWKTGKNHQRERALDGHDIEVGAQLPYIPSGKIYLKNWKWNGEDGAADIKGNTYSLAFSHLLGNGIMLEVGRKDYDGATKDQDFGKLTYQIPMGQAQAFNSTSLFSTQMFETASMKPHMLDKVRRTNEIVVQTAVKAKILVSGI